MEMDERRKSTVKVTRGMANIQKHAARKCPNCNLGIGVYPGRYPDKCPNCGHSLRPTVDEQIALVQQGVPASDVKWLAEGNVDLVDVGTRIDGGEPIEEIIGKFKDAFKKGLAGIKKGAADIRGEGKKKKERKATALAGAAEKKRKKARALGRKSKKAAGKEKVRLKTAAKKTARQAAKGHKKARKVGKQVRSGKFKDKTKKPQKEQAMTDQWNRSQYRNQIEPIRRAIGEMISTNGFARLDKIQERFKTNPVALRNIVRTHAEQWNVVLTESNGRVYPRKHGGPING